MNNNLIHNSFLFEYGKMPISFRRIKPRILIQYNQSHQLYKYKTKTIISISTRENTLSLDFNLEQA